ncbi:MULTISPECIES: SixA phosphatase family protein [Tenacibaculum]|uniref:Histidine phosphatase family protein n=2 Tax=Tenacibaculum TaxID=104267 RepID=A0AAE9SEJ2_9FLAO|nr:MULTISPECIES: histidine phosphatase family protein [Tenacibaculum]GFD73708.1 phosphohistidine phosphatase SixA [Tenacibaculum sp. KUL113]GFD81156.1 phosphohistidine phosphatase SixA [Tenacibaculum sp. KUL118]GFD95418.1 phosphohistidine phosphatase SixA [Alteromonas sp. KUL154]GFE02239.1 phosphohistidine phosphatase SixA [Alteromonas sp. KUL156]KAF9658383.1 histidine phosphatase family protein [Tenacibaculum mesophilum]
MKTLYIVRHAKSSWKYESVKDIDRPLKERGINDAHLLSKYLAEEIKRPDVFLSSSANRALHTAVIFCENFGYPLSNLKIKRQLYSFSDGYLVKTVKALDDSFNSAIVFSHDHGINSFVNKFGNKPIAHVTTCGVVGIEFDTKHWKDIKKGNTVLVEFPKNHR